MVFQGFSPPAPLLVTSFAWNGLPFADRADSPHGFSLVLKEVRFPPHRGRKGQVYFFFLGAA